MQTVTPNYRSLHSKLTLLYRSHGSKFPALLRERTTPHACNWHVFSWDVHNVSLLQVNPDGALDLLPLPYRIIDEARPQQTKMTSVPWFRDPYIHDPMTPGFFGLAYGAGFRSLL